MMCRRYLNYELDDTFQMANWRQRPMPEEMLQYAAIEVQVLLPLESAIEGEKIAPGATTGRSRYSETEHTW